MIDRRALLADLRRQLKRLEQDLAERSESVQEMKSALESEYRAARDAERTGDTFQVWRAGALTQAAVAWLLGCVFVRFVEDNGLVDAALIAGPGERNARAADRQTLYFRSRPTDTDRDYLLDVFAEVARLPGMARLYDREHNPVWRHGISGDAARDLLAFWRAVNPDTGALHHDFTDPDWDTRFLGDLYQDLSDEAKNRYALLQTPEFVEEFILDRTLTPALDEFGLSSLRLIDPACGSGHFLLGAFPRLLRKWFTREPGTPERVLVQRALDGVYGVDINPFAAAIARFRLLVAALHASRVERLKEAPTFRINVTTGDSLLHGRRFDELDLGSGVDQIAARNEFGHAFLAEDLDELNRVLGQQYHVVVGNPPYVTEKDKALNRLYRARYSTCHRQYSLAVPFIERFFHLAMPGTGSAQAGHVGMIVANSFMKREFGKKLVEWFLPTVDLTHAIDTSGAHIPGHATPTAILFGRRRAPIGTLVRTAMGVKGDLSKSIDASKGNVWSAIVSFVDYPNSRTEWVSIADTPRSELATHPWNFGTGAAPDLKRLMDDAPVVLKSLVELPIGRAVRIANEEVYFFDLAKYVRLRLPRNEFRDLLIGECVRDWSAETDILVWYPYVGNCDSSPLLFELWPWRTTLAARRTFQGTMRDAGLKWYEYMQHTASAYSTPLSITFAFVSTHNHFVLDRGGKVFNRSAPVIKLPADSTENDHLALVGLLNSSAACFWMKQTFHDKGGSGAWERRFEYAATALQKFPVPKSLPVHFAFLINCLATERTMHLPKQLVDRLPMTLAEFDTSHKLANRLLSQMIALQEELDWECYGLYGMLDGDYRYLDDAGDACNPPPLALGERAFEIVMGRRMAAGELKTTWFARHRSTPVTKLPTHWPDDYRALVERRIELITSDQFIGLVERPEYKRRWYIDPWQDQEQRALRTWLLSRLESPAYWPKTRLSTVRDLAERAATDADFLQVAARYTGHAAVDAGTLVSDLVESESVPGLPVQRYKTTGLAKRRDWERTWAVQRREDEIDAEVLATTPRRDDESEDEHTSRLQVKQRHRKSTEIGDLAAPPKYLAADFVNLTYWRMRGGLDVPKERFVSFPHMSRDNDPTLLVGWAGWSALELCQAVAAYASEVIEQDGWPAERLTPLLAVLQENLPWLKQWHNEIDPEYNQRLGDFFETYLHSQLSIHGLTEHDLHTWTPPDIGRRRRAKRRTGSTGGATV